MDLERGWVALPATAVRAAVGLASGQRQYIRRYQCRGLQRLPALIERHEPDIVIVELGGNDGLRGYPIAKLRSNLTQMIEISRSQVPACRCRPWKYLRILVPATPACFETVMLKSPGPNSPGTLFLRESHSIPTLCRPMVYTPRPAPSPGYSTMCYPTHTAAGSCRATAMTTREQTALQKQLETIIFGTTTPAGRAFDLSLLALILASVAVVMLDWWSPTTIATGCCSHGWNWALRWCLPSNTW